MPTIPGQYACSVYEVERNPDAREDGRLGSVKWTKPNGAVVVFDFFLNSETTLRALRRFAMEHVDDYRVEDYPAGEWIYKNEPARWELYNRMRREVLAHLSDAMDTLHKGNSHGTQG